MGGLTPSGVPPPLGLVTSAGLPPVPSLLQTPPQTPSLPALTIPAINPSPSPSPPLSPIKPTPLLKPPNKGFGIKISLNTSRPQTTTIPPVFRPKPVSAVFNADSSDSEEEIPAEARMKMRNVGRETITSSGPNSFGK